VVAVRANTELPDAFHVQEAAIIEHDPLLNTQIEGVHYDACFNGQQSRSLTCGFRLDLLSGQTTECNPVLASVSVSQHGKLDVLKREPIQLLQSVRGEAVNW